MIAILRSGAVLLLLFTLTTGLAYPLVVTAAAQGLFPQEASGSLVRRDGQVVASSLIGQSFESPGYFWGRPSATTPGGYNGAASTGSNLGPTNPSLLAATRKRVADLRAADPSRASKPVPVDLVTASGSGLDPHISVAAALYQHERVAQVRGISSDLVRDLVSSHTEGRSWGIFGEPRVNVVQLNLALDALARQAPKR